jgi:transposase
LPGKTIHQCECSDCTQSEDHPEKETHYQMNLFLSRLDEQQRRWYVALEAKRQGYGGMTQVSKITGMHVQTIRRGRDELDNGLADRPQDRVRLPGGGRRSVEKEKSAVEKAIETLVEDDTGGDPMSDKKWVRCTVRWVRKRLKKKGYVLSRSTVWRLLKQLNYSLRANRKDV